MIKELQTIGFSNVKAQDSTLNTHDTSDSAHVDVAIIIGEMKKLVKDREAFEKAEYARSNQQLYKILSQAYAQYLLAKKSTKLFKDTVQQLRDILKADGSKVQANTLAINLFVRFVFRTDRQRAHNYSRTLQAAYAQNIPPNQLAEFITAAGGVEDCKKQVAKSEKTLKSNAVVKQAMPRVEELIFEGIASPLAKMKVTPGMVTDSCSEEMTFLIGKSDHNGNVQVISVVPGFSKGFANWAKKQLATYLAEHQAAAATNTKAQEKEEAIASAVTSARRVSTAGETVGELLAA